jgi:hypothetical protein
VSERESPPDKEKSAPRQEGGFPKVIAATKLMVSQPGDIPAILPRRCVEPLSDYLRMRRPRAEFVAASRRAALAGAQTALDIEGRPRTVVLIERGQRFTAWIRPDSVIADLERLGIRWQRDATQRCWMIPLASVDDLVAALGNDRRAVEIVEVTR